MVPKAINEIDREAGGCFSDGTLFSFASCYIIPPPTPIGECRCAFYLSGYLWEAHWFWDRGYLDVVCLSNGSSNMALKEALGGSILSTIMRSHPGLAVESEERWDYRGVYHLTYNFFE